MERGETPEITLSDIETMINILERFIRLSKKAERIVRQLAPYRTSGQADFMKEFMAMAVREKMQGVKALEEEYEEEPLDEETKALIEKIRAKKQEDRAKV
jgi:hypothetical protein